MWCFIWRSGVCRGKKTVILETSHFPKLRWVLIGEVKRLSKEAHRRFPHAPCNWRVAFLFVFIFADLMKKTSDAWLTLILNSNWGGKRERERDRKREEERGKINGETAKYPCFYALFSVFSEWLHDNGVCEGTAVSGTVLTWPVTGNRTVPLTTGINWKNSTVVVAPNADSLSMEVMEVCIQMC